jgi:hypothetical protein
MLMFVGLTLFSGCSSSSIQEKSINDYILLEGNIPEGFVLTPMSDDKSSPTRDKSNNPGGFNPNYTFGSNNQFNQKNQYEETMNLSEGEYTFVSYTHKETKRNIVLTLIDSKAASRFSDVGHTGSTKVMITKEGHLIWIQSSIITDDFINLYIGEFENVNLRTFSN